jgi:ribonuclease HII
METTAVETVTTETTQSVEPTVEIDEDYKWLTDRLDAVMVEMQATRTAFEQQLEANREASQNQLMESQTLIRSLTELVTSGNQTLSAIAAASVLSKSIPNNSETTLQETEPEPNPIVEPVNVAEENPAPKTEERKRKRL